MGGRCLTGRFLCAPTSSSDGTDDDEGDVPVHAVESNRTTASKHNAAAAAGDDRADDLGDDGSGAGWVGEYGKGTGKASEEMGVTDDDASRWYLENVMTRDSYNFDGGSAYRLEGGRILVAFTSPCGGSRRRRSKCSGGYCVSLSLVVARRWRKCAGPVGREGGPDAHAPTTTSRRWV